MSNSIVRYERFDKDGVELAIDVNTGESFVTKRGYARMGKVDESTVRKRLQGADCHVIKRAEIPTRGGLQGADLIPGKLALRWLAKDNPELLAAMGEAGWNVYCHKLAGFEVRSTAIATHQIPETLGQALMKAALLALENEKLTAKIEHDAPMVTFAESVQASDDAIDFNSFAKAIGTGRTRLFRLMRDIGVIMQNTTLPYQRWCDAGYFEVSQEVTSDGKLRPFALVTGKGQIWLKQKIDHYLFKEQQMAGLILQGVLGLQ